MKLHFSMCLVAVWLLILNGCNHEEASILQPGNVTFSFKKKISSPTGGRVSDTAVPAFVSYTLKKPDGSTISDKIELYQFNGDFVTQPQQLNVGHYSLDQFLILDANNKILYAAPVAGSDMADLVQHPLPLSFDVTTGQVTNLVPEVLALEDHTPGDFGYVAFGFEVVQKFDFAVTATIADNNPHDSINYTLEIIAKDVALGTIKWTKIVSMSRTGTVHVPAQYGHYTFKATKLGYLPHVQHVLVAELNSTGNLSFEFLPETLEGFISQEQDGIKIYLPNDQNRCKLYARIDMPEGYRIDYSYADRSATAITGTSLASLRYNECLPTPDGALLASPCGKNVNLFDNTPFAIAADYCSTVDLSASNAVHSIEDVMIESYLYIDYYKPGSTQSTFSDLYHNWKGANNH